MYFTVMKVFLKSVFGESVIYFSQVLSTKTNEAMYMSVFQEVFNSKLIDAYDKSVTNQRISKFFVAKGKFQILITY